MAYAAQRPVAMLPYRWASMEMAQSQVRKGNWEIVSPFDTLKRFGCARFQPPHTPTLIAANSASSARTMARRCLCWIAYPIINVLGALSLISNEQEEIGQARGNADSALVTCG